MTTTFTASAASAGHDHAHEEASLLIGSRWATPDAPGGRTVISYSFGIRGASYAPEEADFSATLAEFSEADKQTTRDVLHSIEAVCNVEFVEVADTGAGHGVLRYAYSQQPTALGHAGYAFYPSSADVGTTHSSITRHSIEYCGWFDTSWKPSSITSSAISNSSSGVAGGGSRSSGNANTSNS